MKFLNLTPHTIRVCGENGDLLREIHASGQVARVSVRSEMVGDVEGLPVYRVVRGAVVGLPSPEVGTVLIVSLLVREAALDRSDLFSPGELIRGSDGQPTGCRGLVGNGGVL